MATRDPLVQRTHKLLQIAIAIAFAYSILVALRQISELVTALGAAFVLAYLLNPAVDWLCRRKVPRVLAVLLVFLAVTTFVVGVASAVVPLVAGEFDTFAEIAPQHLMVVERWIEEFTGSTLAGLWNELRADITRWLGEIDLQGLLSRLGGGIGAVWSLALIVGLTPIFTIYLLLDFPRLIRFLGALIPPRHRGAAFGIIGEISDVIAHWVRGELVVMITLSALYSLGFVVAGVPLAVLVGCTAGLLHFIPYVGPGCGLTLGLILTVMDWQGWPPLAGLLAVFTVVQTLDGLYITPRVLGGSVGLNPAAVIAGLIICGSALGIAGVMIAVPLSASVVVIGRHVLRSYRASAFFRDGSEHASAYASGLFQRLDATTERPPAGEDQGAQDPES